MFIQEFVYVLESTQSPVLLTSSCDLVRSYCLKEQDLAAVSGCADTIPQSNLLASRPPAVRSPDTALPRAFWR